MPRRDAFPSAAESLSLDIAETDEQKAGPLEEDHAQSRVFQGPMSAEDARRFREGAAYITDQLTFLPFPEQTPGSIRPAYDEFGRCWLGIRYDDPGTARDFWAYARFYKWGEPDEVTDLDGDSRIYWFDDDVVAVDISGTNVATVDSGGINVLVGDLDLPLGGNVTVAGADPIVTETFDAGELEASLVNGAATGVFDGGANGVHLDTFDFDGTTQEYVQLYRPFPDGWNGGTVTVRFHWMVTTVHGVPGTYGVRWGAQAFARGDGVPLDSAWGTAQEVTDSVTSPTTLNRELITSSTAAITIGGSPAGGQGVQFRFYRNPADAADDMGPGVDARLIGGTIEWSRGTFSD